MESHDSRVDSEGSAGAPELTMEMVKAGLSAFDEGMGAGEEVVEILPNASV